MAQSTLSANRRKGTPGKPHSDFPLTPHRGTGRWCKKVRGKLHYFGKIEGDEEGQAALDEWLRSDRAGTKLSGLEPAVQGHRPAEHETFDGADYECRVRRLEAYPTIVNGPR